MEFIRSTKEGVEKQAIIKLKEHMERIASKEGRVVLAIPGGRSVQGLFEKLSKADIDWSNVHIFWVDERWVPLDDPNSNYQIATFLKNVPAQNTHPFRCEEGIDAYEQELKKYGGRFDIVILGVGKDGHVGALFPHDSVDNEAAFFIKLDNSPKPPPKRMTSSRRLIGQAQVAFVVFFGEAKREAFESFMDDTISVSVCPAKIVESIEYTFVLTDL